MSQFHIGRGQSDVQLDRPLCPFVQRGGSNQWTDRCEDQRRRSWRRLSRNEAN